MAAGLLILAVVVAGLASAEESPTWYPTPNSPDPTLPAVRFVLWFRSDLRLHDNAIVHAAATYAGRKEVIAVYIFDPREYEADEYGVRRTGRHRARFIFEAVSHLRSNLQEIGSELIVGWGRPEELIPLLTVRREPEASQNVQENEEFAIPEAGIPYDVEAAVRVLCQTEASPEKRSVIDALRAALPAGVQFETEWGALTLHSPTLLPFFDQQGALTQMPTSFRRFREVTNGADDGHGGTLGWESAAASLLPIPLPMALPLPGSIWRWAGFYTGNERFNTPSYTASSLPELADKRLPLGFDYLPPPESLGLSAADVEQKRHKRLAAAPPPPAAFGSDTRPRGGEYFARGELRRLLWEEEGCLGEGGAQGALEPWLASGCLSPRMAAREVARYEREKRAGGAGQSGGEQSEGGHPGGGHPGGAPSAPVSTLDGLGEELALRDFWVMLCLKEAAEGGGTGFFRTSVSAVLYGSGGGDGGGGGAAGAVGGGAPHIYLFTRAGCSLCEKVKATLSALSPTHPHTLEAVDITDGDKRYWWGRYKYDIPVLHMGAEYWTKHRLSEEEAVEALQEASGGSFSSRDGQPDAERLERKRGEPTIGDDQQDAIDIYAQQASTTPPEGRDPAAFPVVAAPRGVQSPGGQGATEWVQPQFPGDEGCVGCWSCTGCWMPGGTPPVSVKEAPVVEASGGGAPVDASAWMGPAADLTAAAETPRTAPVDAATWLGAAPAAGAPSPPMPPMAPDDALFLRWTLGQLGVPLIDAYMRELTETVCYIYITPPCPISLARIAPYPHSPFLSRIFRGSWTAAAASWSLAFMCTS